MKDRKLDTKMVALLVDPLELVPAGKSVELMVATKAALMAVQRAF